MKNTNSIVVFITCSSKGEANKIKKALLERRHVACVSIIPAVCSFFWWEGKIDSAHEVLLLAKTKNSMFKKIVTLVKQIHKYQVPEIIALPIIYGNKEYLKWINRNLEPGGNL